MRSFVLASALALGSACASPEPYDYGRFLAHYPRSILVIPPLDNTVEVDATYSYLATVTRPLAERGYYVFPVGVVDRILRDNGLLGPAEMQTAPLSKLYEIFGADAVLYTSLEAWGTSYQVLNSSTQVTVNARLVDARTGTEIWSGSQTARQNSGGGSLGEMLAGALVNQIATSISDPSADVARQANYMLFHNEHHGLLLGHRHREFGESD